MVKAPETGRTMKAAYKAAQDQPGQIVKAGELIQAQFPRGVSPSLPARRVLALMMGAAAGDGWRKQTHSITKKEIRQTHKSNEHIEAILKEVAGIRLTMDGISSRGHPARIISALVRIVMETDEDDCAWIEFNFYDDVRRLLGASDVYGTMNRAALLAFRSKYTVTLYELGCLLCGRRDPTQTLTMEELREKAGVEDGKYPRWVDLKRFMLQRAQSEINQLAHFQMTVVENRRGRKVVSVTLGFWPKDEAGMIEAAKELDQPHTGRKARREKTVERLAAEQKDLRRKIDEEWEQLPLPKPGD
jgi:hypothetical protein